MEAFERLLERVKAAGSASSEEINPFWARQLRRFTALIAKNPSPTPEEVVRSLGYWDDPLPEGMGNRDLPNWPVIEAAMDGVGLEELSKPNQEHAGALAVLRRNNHLEDYLAAVDSWRIVSAMPIARHYLYRHWLMRYLKRTTSNVLEVGAGGGQFAMLLTLAGAVGHYVIVDLPEMMLNSMATLTRAFPDAAIHLGEKPDFSQPAPAFWFLQTNEIELVADGSVDLALNFNSFMEMAEDVRNYYIDQIYRATRSGALFYNVNRFQRGMTRRDGEPYDNNPLLYPYRPTDQVLEWAPDLMQQDVRSKLFHSWTKSFCMMRISRMA